MAINKELLSILACPACKGSLVLAGGEEGLICYACGLIYEIRDDIPIMLVDEARRLDEKELSGLQRAPGPPQE
ncbi:MAG: Trm112 family protein [Syntrophales bacterium]|nr:Trm112 family protein [Syntrophales bacterium]